MSMTRHKWVYICYLGQLLGASGTESRWGSRPATQEFMVAKNAFNPQIFLSIVGTGKTVSKYRKGQVIFAQGEVADTIYYLQKGRIKVVVLSEQGKEAVVGLLEAGAIFLRRWVEWPKTRLAPT